MATMLRIPGLFDRATARGIGIVAPTAGIGAELSGFDLAGDVVTR